MSIVTVVAKLIVQEAAVETVCIGFSKSKLTVAKSVATKPAAKEKK